jgi:hypothetical protein
MPRWVSAAKNRNNCRMIDALIERMTELLGPMEAAGDPKRIFHATYLRTTIAVAEEIKRPGGFADPEWTERWDVAFADLYLDALEQLQAGEQPSQPWAVTFGAQRALPVLNRLLLGMNAHINYDLPQALLAVITDEEFDDAELIARREADHKAIDDILAARVSPEGDELASIVGPVSLQNRLLKQFNQSGTRRFLREARQKVWANAVSLSRARRTGGGAYAARLAELEELSCKHRDRSCSSSRSRASAFACRTTRRRE